MSDDSGVAGHGGGPSTGNPAASGPPARQAAYAELVAAVLDLRSPTSTMAFDQAVAEAVAAGLLPEPLARELRWLQRRSLRDVVDHAASVLPATLVALEGGDHHSTTVAAAPVPEPTPAASEGEPKTEPDPSPPVDLTARRLLVAGLRPIADPPFP